MAPSPASATASRVAPPAHLTFIREFVKVRAAAHDGDPRRGQACSRRKCRGRRRTSVHLLQTALDCLEVFVLLQREEQRHDPIAVLAALSGMNHVTPWSDPPSSMWKGHRD